MENLDLVLLPINTVDAEFIAKLGKEKVSFQEYDPIGNVVPQVLQTKAETSGFIRLESTGIRG